ncbi:MAG: zinc ribbon domain-containing protein [Candidatus Odinarchaeum yellowstonii]|uniref:Zinc ribbon domain-containing protein n=1 Tax=Odinarchaeota yellowstonii (strain LCB_4) TaxID=1841599 RepID=A0AAF0D1Y1_ODILC|nr:MAG: zinc ribbon domain-containing protein [Candidatus Odinarchaeum yellowstonii]
MSFKENFYIQKYVETLREQGKSASTIEGVVKILKLFLKNIEGKDLKQVEDVDVQEWQINLLNEGRKPSTVTRYTRVVYNFLKVFGVHLKVVYPKQHLKNNLRFLTVDQLKALYECTDDPKDRAIISLFTETGIKTSELINLRRRNFFEQSIILPHLQTYRVLNLPDIVNVYLIDYLNSKSCIGEDDLIFSTGVNTPQGKLSYASLNFLFKNITEKLSKACSIHYKITPQILRNTFIYLQLIRGVPVELIRRQLGLKKPNIIKKIKAQVKETDNLKAVMLVECSNCKSMIQPHMKICPYCFADLPNLICPECNRFVKRDFKFCPYCGFNLKS